MTQLKDTILSAFLGVLIAFGIVIAVGNPLQHEISASAQSMNMSNDQSMGTMTSSNTMSGNRSAIVRDSQTILLEGKTIPAKGYVHLYDSTPFLIMSGHVAAKLPCNSASNATVQVLVGSAPDLKPADLELIKELSTPGKLCLYHVDIPPNATTVVTDIAISNPGTSTITFPATSTVVIGVNEIMPRAEEGEHSH
jgi:hypothetical protein